MENDLIVETRPVESLTPEEKQAIDQVDHIAFAPGPGQTPNYYAWAGSEYYVTGRLEEKIVAIIGILVRQARVGSQAIRLGGIGGVATLPEYRGRGYATTLLAEARRFMIKPLQVDFGLLVCDVKTSPLYLRSGWQTVSEHMLFDQPGGKCSWLGLTMVIPCRETSWPPGEIDLCGLPW